MYRPRLKSRAGCLRCRKRHVKCDEAWPKCSFCARWNLECVRPAKAVQRSKPLPVRQVDNVRASTTHDRTERVSGDSQGALPKEQAAGTIAPTHGNTMGVSDQILTLRRTPTRATRSFDPFHNFPITESQYNPAMAPILQRFFGDIEATYSHDLARVYSGFRLAFFEDLHEDEAVFFSIVSYCAAFQVTRDTTQPIARLKLEAEKSTLSLLRGRIEGDTVVTDATVLAAVMHVFLVTYDTIDGPHLRRMMNGVNALARAQAHNGRRLSDITKYMLLLCNILCSLFNADEPCRHDFRVRPRPKLLDLVYRPQVNFPGMDKYLSRDVVRMFHDLDFVLFFRTSSEKFYSLSHTESSYIFELLNSIDVQLTTLQVQHIGGRSLDEIATLGGILVKQEVVAYSMHQLTAILQILKRLQQAILMHPVEASTDMFESFAMWSCFTALIGRGLESTRKWFSDFILAMLLERCKRGSVTHGWMLDLHLEMRQLPWHERMDVYFTAVCETFSEKHMHVVNINQ